MTTAEDMKKTPSAGSEARGDANALPSAETLRVVGDLPVLDSHGKSHVFKDILVGPDVGQRVLVVFIRHFYCPACQTYARELAASAKPEGLKSQSPSTSIVFIACGDYRLIDHWEGVSECRFPVFTDPTTKLHEALGLVAARDIGNQQGYYQASVFQSFINAASQAFWKIPAGLAHRGGPPSQHGGEFLFEASPAGGDKTVTWCHRMQHATDHTGFPAILKVLNVDEAESS